MIHLNLVVGELHSNVIDAKTTHKFLVGQLLIHESEVVQEHFIDVLSITKNSEQKKVEMDAKYFT